MATMTSDSAIATGIGARWPAAQKVKVSTIEGSTILTMKARAIFRA